MLAQKDLLKSAPPSTWGVSAVQSTERQVGDIAIKLVLPLLLVRA
jgi:hypothetical protein